MVVLLVFAISCAAQETPDDAAMQPIRSLIQQIQDASETQNGWYYAWHLPLKQPGMGLFAMAVTRVRRKRCSTGTRLS
jgi:hypothetical protein